MGSLGNSKTWMPYLGTKDCSQDICTLYCPQHCYIIFPPPPPPPSDDTAQPVPHNFSPLMISIIGILASAFLLVCYYALISKYCGNSDNASRRRPENEAPNNEDLGEDNDPSSQQNYEPWVISTNGGLEEALIKAITLVKYKKGSGFVGSTDCSVCLGEFLEDESLRLLPKCSHAFHVSCIDTWLKSHSSCPLCRANIAISSFEQSPQPSLMIDNGHNDGHNQDHEHQVDSEENRTSDPHEGRDMGFSEQASDNIPKSPIRAFSDLGELGLRECSVIDVIDHEGNMMRRSFSMDHTPETRVSISGILRFNQEKDCQVGYCH